jgi:hypothetical protein
MPRLDVLDEEFGEDAAASLHARRRRIGSDGKPVTTRIAM